MNKKDQERMIPCDPEETFRLIEQLGNSAPGLVLLSELGRQGDELNTKKMNQELNTDLEHSRLLKETGIEFEPDGYWMSIDNGKTYFFTNGEIPFNNSLDPDIIVIKSTRTDKILAKLPEWVFETEFKMFGEEVKIVTPKIDRLLNQWTRTPVDVKRWCAVDYTIRVVVEHAAARGQAAANAAAKLLHLLWKEKLL